MSIQTENYILEELTFSGSSEMIFVEHLLCVRHVRFTQQPA